MTPDWSPDSTTVAFSRDNPRSRSSNWDIYKIGSDRRVQRMRYRLQGYELDPAWTTDGKAIAIAFDGDFHGERTSLVLLQVGTGLITSIPGLPRGGFGAAQADPSWSRDGRGIAFSQFVDPGEFWVYVSRDGKPARGIRRAWNPAWAPDGNAIGAEERATRGLVVLDLDGHVLHRITVVRGTSVDPDWGR